jgi:hypothetical protein
MDNIRHLLARNVERTLPEQVQFAYLTLLGRIEQFSADLLDEIEKSDSESARESLEWVHTNLNRLLSKNVRLRHKLLHEPPPPTA